MPDMRLITADRFAKMAWNVRKRGQGRMPDDLIVMRSFASTVAVEESGARQLTYTITTGAVDRQNDTIDVRGWDLDAYLKSPVVLWGHNHDLVIGKALSIERDGVGLRSTVEFQPRDMPIVGDWAEYAFRSGQTGFVRATSVGFRPIEYELTEDPERGGDGWFPGIDFMRQELTEFSVVGVPANPEALIHPAIALPSTDDVPADPENQPAAQGRSAHAALSRQLRDIRARRLALPV